MARGPPNITTHPQEVQRVGKVCTKMIILLVLALTSLKVGVVRRTQ